MRFLNLCYADGSGTLALNIDKFTAMEFYDTHQELGLFLAEDNLEMEPRLILTAGEFSKAVCSQELHFHCMPVQKFVAAVKAANEKE